MTNLYQVRIKMIMLKSIISWMVHNPPTLSPQLAGMKGCNKPSTIFQYRVGPLNFLTSSLAKFCPFY